MVKLKAPLGVQELVDAHFDLSVKDPDAWAELIADDAVWEFPYGRSVGMSELQGKAAIVELVRKFLKPLSDFTYGERTVHILSEGSAVAEFTSQGIVRENQRIYANTYVLFLETADGKITRLREYFDPHAIAHAFAENG